MGNPAGVNGLICNWLDAGLRVSSMYKQINIHPHDTPQATPSPTCLSRHM